MEKKKINKKNKPKKTQSFNTLILANYSNNWQNVGSCHAENDNFLIEQIYFVITNNTVIIKHYKFQAKQQTKKKIQSLSISNELLQV